MTAGPAGFEPYDPKVDTGIDMQLVRGNAYAIGEDGKKLHKAAKAGDIDRVFELTREVANHLDGLLVGLGYHEAGMAVKRVVAPVKR